MMYLRFVTCLAVGLFGLSLMMMTIYDVLLQDWDVVADIRRAAARWARKQRTRYVLMDEDRMKAVRYSNRPLQPERTSLGTQYRTLTGAAPAVRMPALPDNNLASV